MTDFIPKNENEELDYDLFKIRMWSFKGQLTLLVDLLILLACSVSFYWGVKFSGILVLTESHWAKPLPVILLLAIPMCALAVAIRHLVHSAITEDIYQRYREHSFRKMVLLNCRNLTK